MRSKTIKNLLLCTTMSIMAWSEVEAQTQVWVSPSGIDNGNGTPSAPFASVDGALKYVRQLRKEKTAQQLGEVQVIMQDGIYRITETIRLTTEDSGTPQSPTIIMAAEGSHPVISGGQVVDGWQQAGNVEGLPDVAQGQVWKAPTPKVDGKALRFRQMWVNGVKMRRASTFDDLSMPQIITSDKSGKTFTIPRPMMDLSNAKHLELSIPQDWTVNIMRVKKISHLDEWKSKVYFESEEANIEFSRPYPILKADVNRYDNHKFYLSNAIELLNRPQEWYSDVDNGTLYYWPRYGETEQTVEAIVPSLETLVEIDGSLDNMTSDIQFRGITFEHTTWQRPFDHGDICLQAGQYLWKDGDFGCTERPTSGVSVKNAHNIMFEDCHFQHMGSAAIDLHPGTHNATVRGCLFTDVAGNCICGGYFIEEDFDDRVFTPTDLRATCDSIFVENNLMIDPANEDWGCHGICIGFASNVNILHNEIVDAPYSAISMGWGWMTDVNIMHDNHIEYNYVNGFAKQLRDCGGIYTLSAQLNSTIHANVIDKAGDPEFCSLMWDMKSAQADIYADQGTDYFNVWDNWCSRSDLSMNQNGSHNQWWNNSPNVDASIVREAGLQDAYKDLHNRYKRPTYAPYDSIGDMVNANLDEIEYVGRNEGFRQGHAIAVDLNGDNRRDIVFSGGEGYQTRVGGVRMNTGNYGFAATQALAKCYLGNFAAGDLNGDGHIDLIQGGFDFWDAYNAVLMNDGKGNLDVQQITRENSVSPACGIADINNDGLPDYFFVGDGTSNNFYLQKTNRSGFRRQSLLKLPGGFSEPNMTYADFDNNQSIDICLLSDKNGGLYTRIHYNDGTGQFSEKEVGIKEKGTRGGTAYADVNGDGYLDIAIGGEIVGEDWGTTGAAGGKTVSLYFNNGDGTFTLAQEFKEYVSNNVTQPISFCDWDNDGYSDLIISGWNTSEGQIAQVDVFLNDGKGHFTKSDVDLPGVCESSLELADFSGNGRNDILISGNTNGAMGWHGLTNDRRIAVLCKNKTERTNTIPTAPDQLTAEVDGNSVQFIWNDGADNETPVMSLSYNYYLKNVDTGVYLTFPCSDIETGTRRITSMGNAYLNHGWKINNLPAGNYAWSVQTIDAGYAGSAFAAEQYFTITEELEDSKTTKDKLMAAGWTQIDDLRTVDMSSSYFAMVDEGKQLTIVSGETDGTKNWGNTLGMYYSDYVNPTKDTNMVFVFDDYSNEEEVRFIASAYNDQNRHFRTESWNHTLWQTYSDVHKEGDSYSVDGSTTLAMLTPEWKVDEGWALRNHTTDAYLGPWATDSYDDGAEFAGDKADGSAAHVTFFAIDRVKYMQQMKDWTHASTENPLDITQLITNPSFGRYDEQRHPIGWIMEGDGEVTHDGKMSKSEYYAYMGYVQTKGKLSDRATYQTLKNMPAGRYRIIVLRQSPVDGAYLFANDSTMNLKHTGNADAELDFTMGKTGDLTFGIRLVDYQRYYMRFDNFRLYYLGIPEDVNQDGTVNSLDVLKVYKFMQTSTGEENGVIEDVNGDGKVNSLDVLKIYKYMQTH